MEFADLSQHFDELARGGLRRLIGRALKAGAIEAEAEGRTLAGGRMRVRSGHLRRSIVGLTTDDGDTQSMILRAGEGAKDVKYARLQELGGTVRPVNAKMLAMPWPGGPAETSSGVARYTSPRQFPGELRFIKTLKGGLLVRDMGRAGRKGQRSEIVYMLLYQSTIKPKHYMRDAFAVGQKEVATALGEGLAAIMGPP